MNQPASLPSVTVISKRDSIGCSVLHIASLSVFRTRELHVAERISPRVVLNPPAGLVAAFSMQASSLPFIAIRRHLHVQLLLRRAEQGCACLCVSAWDSVMAEGNQVQFLSLLYFQHSNHLPHA